MNLPRSNAKFGFSLIELLVVISIIGILVAAATVSWTNAQQKSRDSKRKSDLKSIQNTLEIYLQDHGSYPDGDANGLIRCPDPSTGAPTSINWGSTLSCFTPAITYMNPLPKDPVGQTIGLINHTYYYNPDAPAPSSSVILGYTLSAGLENNKDPEHCPPGCTPNPHPCTAEAGRSYCVVNP